MLLRTLRLAGLAGIVALAAAAVATAQAPNRDGQDLRRRLLENYDRDADGRLSPEERENVRRDVRDGKLEVPEAIRRQWRQRKPQPPGSAARGPGVSHDKVVFERDVEYGKAGDRPLKLDVVKPKKPEAESLPVVVFIHGGGWRSGDKRGGAGRVAPLAATGQYVGVSVGYRLSGEAPWPAQIHDCKAAIRWIRANAEKLGADPNRIGVWGSSAGGHLVNMLGTSGDLDELEGDCGSADQSDRVSCVVSFCGPADFVAPKQFEGGRRPNAVDQLLGGRIEDCRDLARQASPITHVSKDDPPFLLVHGDSDRTVPYEQAERFRAALDEAGVDVTLLTIRGGGHGIGGPEVIERVNRFFAKHLRGEDVEASAEPIDAAR